MRHGRITITTTLPDDAPGPMVPEVGYDRRRLGPQQTGVPNRQLNISTCGAWLGRGAPPQIDRAAGTAARSSSPTGLTKRRPLLYRELLDLLLWNHKCSSTNPKTQGHRAAERRTLPSGIVAVLGGCGPRLAQAARRQVPWTCSRRPACWLRGANDSVAWDHLPQHHRAAMVGGGAACHARWNSS